MADYNKTLEDSYSILNWGDTFNASKRVPMIAKRIWSNLSELTSWVKDTSTDSTACAGLIVTVIDDDDNNGAYLVKSVGADGVIERIGSASSIDCGTY